MATNDRTTLTVSTLEDWLWNAACQIRGPVDAPKFKDYILPLVFLKRVSDVFEDKVCRLAEDLGDRDFAEQVVEIGRPKNYMTAEHVQHVARIYHEWRAEEGISAIVTNEEAAKNDYNLSPSRYVAGAEQEEVLPLEEAAVLLREAEEERAEADRSLKDVLARLGL